MGGTGVGGGASGSALRAQPPFPWKGKRARRRRGDPRLAAERLLSGVAGVPLNSYGSCTGDCTPQPCRQFVGSGANLRNSPALPSDCAPCIFLCFG